MRIHMFDSEVSITSSSKNSVTIFQSKADKLKRGPAKAALLSVRRQLASLHPEASVQLFSALKKTGTEEAIQVLNRWFGIVD